MMIWYYIKALERAGLFVWTLRVSLAICLVVLCVALSWGWEYEIADASAGFRVVWGLVCGGVFVVLGSMVYWLAREVGGDLQVRLKKWTDDVALDARRLKRQERERQEAGAAHAGALSVVEQDGEGMR